MLAVEISPVTFSASPPSTTATVDALRKQLARVESGTRSVKRPSISSGQSALDAILPNRGFTAGSLVEWVAAEPGSGATLLALLAGREACRPGGRLLVIDRLRRFYPPAAASWGIAPEQIVLVHPANETEQHWAMLQALRCEQVAAVLTWGDRLDSRHARRLQLAAETSGVLGLLVRGAEAIRQPCWSDLRCLVRPQAGTVAWRLRVEVVRHRGGGLPANHQVEIKL